VISPEEVEKKVTDYLRKSQALTDYWQQPITAAQLHAEMDRMAHDTKQPEVLRELFEALGNDPVVIAECLARPIFAERMLANLTHGRKGPPGRPLSSARDSARPAVAPYQSAATVVANLDNVAYKLPEISVPDDCADNSWMTTTTTNAPEPRDGETAVWTGNEMITWVGKTIPETF